MVILLYSVIFKQNLEKATESVISRPFLRPAPRAGPRVRRGDWGHRGG